MRRYHAIFSPSYSGSTLLSSLINSFADTTSIGELHWTLDHDLSRVRCSECGINCPIVGPLIRRRQWGELSDVNLYPSVLDITGKHNLFTSDKYRANVVRFLPTGGDGAILLFKAPWQLYASGKRHASPWLYHFFEPNSVYVKIYSGLLGWLPTWADKIYYCNYNTLTAEPQQELARIGEFFDLKLKPRGMIYPPENWHNLFGNSAWKNNYFNQQIKSDDRWQTELTPQEKRGVRADHLVEMYERLSALALKGK